jgi:hypothetical protein
MRHRYFALRPSGTGVKVAHVLEDDEFGVRPELDMPREIVSALVDIT